MMLTIHGLPVSIKYLDLKTLIKKECNIGDFILDNLVNEAGGSKKVRIGVADEAEGARLTKCLNGYRMGSSLLRVVPVGKAAATLTPSNFNQQGVFAPRNAISNQQGYVVQPVTLMGNQQGLWNTGTPSNQWSSNQTQSQNFNFQQGSTSSFSTQVFLKPSGPSNQRPPVQRDVYTFNRSMPEQVFGFAAKSTATPAPGSSQITGHGNLSYPIQGQGQPSTWNQTMQQQKPLPFEKHNHSQLGNASNKFASVDKRPGMPLLERPTAQSRRISPPGRRVSPSWRRNSPSGRRASPSRWVALQGVGGSHREIGGPPHASLSDRRISPGRGVSPNDRRMARQPNRRDSPGRRLVSPPRRESPTRHMRYSPSRRLTSNPNFDSEGRSFKQVRPAYEPDPKGPNQAMYSSDYRPAAHESVSYPVQGREKNQRNSPWQQERDKSIFAAQMKKDDDRRDARNPVSRGPEPMVEGKRSSPSPKSRSPIRREIRDRSPVRDRYKRHSPSPRSPRRSWALEKRRSPNMQDAPPPPIWPGPNVEDHYARPGRPNFSERIEKADTVKHIQDWDRRTYDGQAEEGRHEHRMEDNRPYEDINRMRRGIGARDASARREPSPRHGFKAIEPRFSPQDNKQSKFGLRDTKLQPRDREFDPREQKFDPRDSKLDARDSKQDMRDSKQDLRDVKIGARVPTFGARNAEYDARNSKFEHREHNFQIREPKFEHRESKFEPREQKYESRGGEREKYEPRETKYDPRDGCEPKFEPSDPKILRDTKYDSRDPKFEARDDYKDRRDVRRPEFSEREDYRSSQRHGDREEPFRRVDNSREDFKLEDRKDYRKRNDEIDKDFEDIYKRSMEFKQKVEENLRKPDRKQDFREDRQEDDDRRKAYDERERSHNYRDEEMRAYRHNVERDLREDRSRFRHPGDMEKRDVWNVQVKPGIRAMMPHAVKSKRDKAAEEICNKMIHKYGDDNMSEDLKLRVEEELKLLISRILYDMFGDRDVSFIELVVKFNSKHDTRGELKIFQEVMAGFSSHGRMKRPAPDSSAIPAKTSRKSPHPDLKEGVKTRGETYKPRPIIGKSRKLLKCTTQKPLFNPTGKMKAGVLPTKPKENATASPAKAVPSEYSELSERMSQALENELQQITFKVWQELPDDSTSAEDKLVLDKLSNEVCDDFKNVLGLNVTKRLLNIFNPLNVKVHFTTKPERKYLKEFLKKFNFIAFKRIVRLGNTFAAQVKSIEDFDNLTSLSSIYCGAAKITITPCYRFTQCPRNLKTIYTSTDTENVSAIDTEILVESVHRELKESEKVESSEKTKFNDGPPVSQIKTKQVVDKESANTNKYCVSVSAQVTTTSKVAGIVPAVTHAPKVTAITKATPNVAAATKVITHVTAVTKATPNVAAPPKATPNVAAPPKATPNVAAPPKATPNVAAAPKATPNVAAPGKATPNLAAPPKATPNVAAPPKATPNLAAHPKATPNVAAPPKATPNHAAPPKATPNVAAPPKATPNVAAPPKATPNVTAPSKATPNVAAPTKATPNVAALGKATPNVAAVTKATPNVTATTKAPPNVTATTKATPNVAAPGKATPNVAAVTKATPNVTATTKAPPNVTASTKATPSVAAPTKATPNVAPFTKATPNVAPATKVTPSVAVPTKATPNVASPTKATPNVASPTKATPNFATTTKATPNIAAATISTLTVKKTAAIAPQVIETTKVAPNVTKTVDVTSVKAAEGTKITAAQVSATDTVANISLAGVQETTNIAHVKVDRSKCKGTGTIPSQSKVKITETPKGAVNAIALASAKAKTKMGANKLLNKKTTQLNKSPVLKELNTTNVQKILADKDDYEELDDDEILALMSEGIILDECSGSGED